jgi:hypothetical protein
MMEKVDVHDHDPWSEADVSDLKESLEHGASIEEAAQHICRAGTLLAVQRKADELGLKYESRPVAPAPVRIITKAEVVLRDGYYWAAFEFDDGSRWSEPSTSKLQAEFETRDRIGDAVLLGGSPLLRPGSKHPARW